MKHSNNPSRNTIRAEGITDKILNLRRTLTSATSSSSSSGVGESPAPVVRTRKMTAESATARPSRENHGLGGPDFEVSRFCWKRMYLMAEKAKERPWES